MEKKSQCSLIEGVQKHTLKVAKGQFRVTVVYQMLWDKTSSLIILKHLLTLLLTLQKNLLGKENFFHCFVTTLGQGLVWCASLEMC